MPCYFPLAAYRLTSRVKKTEKGKDIILFTKPQSNCERIQLPCGQCIGCRLSRSVMWATRCMNEAQTHEENCFITLTYDEAHLPADYSLSVEDLQKFFKRFRKDIQPKKIRYFGAGEYGDESWRPHYHAIIFGYDFSIDRYPVKPVGSDNQYYISPQLSKIWPLGNHIITDFCFDTAAYVARYCVKKINGDKADDHYHRTIIDWNEFTGEIYDFREVDLLPEFALMSRRPGIGYEWYSRYKSDCYPSDYLVVDERKVPIPKYYDKLLEEENKFIFASQKAKRKIQSIMDYENSTLERLSVREHCKQEQVKTLKRNKT